MIQPHLSTSADSAVGSEDDTPDNDAGENLEILYKDGNHNNFRKHFSFEDSYSGVEKETKSCFFGAYDCENEDSHCDEIENRNRDEGNNIDDDDDEVSLSRPIIVGYAFGPKKMSTMGVVMAEASRAQLSTIRAPPVTEEEEEGSDCESSHILTNKKDVDDVSNYDVLDVSVGVGVDVVFDAETDANADVDIDDGVTVADTDADTDLNGDSRFMQGDKDDPNSNSLCRRYDDKDVHKPENMNNKKVFIHTNDVGGLRNVVRKFNTSGSSAGSTTSLTSMQTTAMNTIASMASTATTSITISTKCNTICCGNKPSSAVVIDGRSIVGRKSNIAKCYPILVSFVPLDPDVPLEEQHGGKLDVILHKLTEDILCLSQMDTDCDEGSNIHLDDKERYDRDSSKDALQNEEKKNAMLRVNRLITYQSQHPECSLVDHPNNVKTLMSRSDIAYILSQCLKNVTSASGIPVSSPKYIVVHHKNFIKEGDSMINDSAHELLVEQISSKLEKEQISYPCIVKPVIAAGTKSSHYMKVLLHPSALLQILPSSNSDNCINNKSISSCIVQEYVNHNEILYKVYVLGDNVYVYQRPSLPDLPEGIRADKPINCSSLNSKNKDCRNNNNNNTIANITTSYVEFNSQFPYPRLADFGVKDDDNTLSSPPAPSLNDTKTETYSSKNVYDDCKASESINFITKSNKIISDGSKNTTNLEFEDGFNHPSIMTDVNNELTAAEVQPIVDALKNAFGLELFGFDIIIASKTNQLLVVDVNYFPSYKEVSNFPLLLAQYLAQRALTNQNFNI